MSEKRFDMILGKQRARARLREFIEKHIFDRRNARVLCLPGENGREIEHVYRKLGFRDENIVGVEMNPRAARGVRSHYPNIDVREGSLEDVVKDIVCSKDEAPFSVVSLDYCGTFSFDKFFWLRLLQTSGKLTDRVVVASNVFAGREQTHIQSQMRLHYGLHKHGSVASELLAQYHYDAEGLADWGEQKMAAAQLGEARDVAARTAIINELLHYGPAHTLSRFYNVCVPVEKATDALKKRGVGRALRQHISALLESPFEGPQIAVMVITEELQETLYKILREHRELKVSNDNVTDPHVISISWARKVASAWSDYMGEAHVPIAAEAFSYVNDAGHRMISDFLFFRCHQDELKRVPRAIVIDTEGGLFLDPAPEDFPSPQEYVRHIHNIVQQYHAVPQLWAQKEPVRVDLGGGAMPIDENNMKERIVKAIKNGRTNEEIMAKWPVTAGSLRALRATVTMGKL